MFKIKKFPNIKQLDQMDCGPTCLRMVAKHYGRTYSKHYIDEKSYKGKLGVNMLNLSDVADRIGFRTMVVRCSFEMLLEEKPVPFIAHWNQNHFVVVHKIAKNKVHVSDPDKGLLTYTKKQFCQAWENEDYDNEGVAMLLEVTPHFYELSDDSAEQKKLDFFFYLKYVIPHYKMIVQLGIGLLVMSVFSLISPFLTQAMMDQGIQQSNIQFVYVVLIAQIMLFFGQTSVGLIRAWIMLHMSTRINISVLSDFLVKLMKLPIAFFDSKNLGDILQRISDHSRIENFLTTKTLETVFSLFNVVLYSFIMLKYSVTLYLVFVVFTIVDFGYVLAFLKKRKKLDYLSFDQSAEEQNTTVGLIQGMQEIKLHACEREKRWNWERVQIKLFKLSIKQLILSQVQGTGASFINTTKGILISFIAAKEVIDGNMTIGMMMAAQQIMGSLSGPIQQFVGLVTEAQDAKISLDRLSEVHNRKDEDYGIEENGFIIPEKQDIVISNLNFRYGDPTADWVLQDFNLVIPYGKTTAIVGESGSGKTTLLKLLTRFYDPEEGTIELGNVDFKKYSTREWRKKCGVVMQQGHIFSDTVANNISVAGIVDKEKLLKAATMSNSKEFIEAMPLNYNTKIGGSGKELSTGQKQRILIARAIYKDPEYMFFDEASSALDSKNERQITNNINEFNKSRTAVIIAHRLSTVRNADNIIVMDRGEVIEQGNHDELVNMHGAYFHLVKNQLELGA